VAWVGNKPDTTPGGELPPERPHRVQLSRRKGWRMPPNTVKVDRTTKWGNPFADYPTREAQAARFRAAVLGPVLDEKQCAPNAHPDSYIGQIIRNAAHELRGKNLACWCPLDAPCHADALLELANAEVFVPAPSKPTGGGG
jgi:hypothetical protein